MPADISDTYDKIYRYCYFKVRNAALAEDLTQETFLKYFKHNPGLERGKQLAYLYTIAKNLCVDTSRRKQDAPLSEDAAGENLMDQAERNIAVRQALQVLAKDQQELLLLRYVNGLSVGETAALCGLSRFAVYRRTNAALSVLKGLLRKEDFT